MLASKVSGKKMMPLLVKIAKGGRTRKDASGALSEKFIYVLEGKVEANIGQERYDLCKNDSLYFVSNTPHYFRNTGSSDARLVSVECPPAS
jgi:quercetin dioxygenase-like cupin family protein